MMPAWIPVARTLSVVTSVAVAAAALSAQESRQRPGGEGPTRLIVRAVANGQPVTDLKAEELTIRVDGKQREIKSLELVSAASPAGGASASGSGKAAPAAALPPPFATNVSDAPAAGPAGGREFVIVLDEEGVAPGQEEPVRNAIAKLLSEANENDRFGFISLRVGGRQIPPGTNRAALNEELAKFVGGGSTTENVVDITCRTKRSLGALSSALQQSPPGRTLVVITSGLAANPQQVQAIRSRVNATGDFDDTVPETCQIRSTDLEDFGVTAAMSPASMYFVHYPQALAAQAHLQIAQTGIENLAGVANAEFVRLTGGNEASLSRVVRETSAYYLATLDDASSGMRRIDARVNREGVKVIARPATTRGGGAARASAKGMSPRDMIKTATSFSDLPLRADGFISRHGTSEMKIVALFEPADPSAKLTAASVAVLDANGKGGQVHLKPEELARAPVAVSLPITPGKYRVRVAATTANAGGTVDFEIDGALSEKGPLKTSAMLVGISGEKSFAPKLQFTASDPMVVGVLEVYGVPKGGNLTAQFEIVDNPSAPQPLGASPGQVGSGPGDDARMVFGGFKINTLEPGDYIMRIRLSLDGKEVGTASRTFRKVTGS